MLDQIMPLIKSLFEEGTDVAATIAQIVNIIVGAVFGFVKESEGYDETTTA